jgi:hypothetical protein
MPVREFSTNTNSIRDKVRKITKFQWEKSQTFLSYEYFFLAAILSLLLINPVPENFFPGIAYRYEFTTLFINLPCKFPFVSFRAFLFQLSPVLGIYGMSAGRGTGSF